MWLDPVLEYIGNARKELLKSFLGWSSANQIFAEGSSLLWLVLQCFTVAAERFPCLHDACNPVQPVPPCSSLFILIVCCPRPLE